MAVQIRAMAVQVSESDQIKQFKRVLGTYNKVTENCFMDCVKDFTTRTSNLKRSEDNHTNPTERGSLAGRHPLPSNCPTQGGASWGRSVMSSGQEEGLLAAVMSIRREGGLLARPVADDLSSVDERGREDFLWGHQVMLHEEKRGRGFGPLSSRRDIGRGRFLGARARMSSVQPTSQLAGLLASTVPIKNPERRNLRSLEIEPTSRRAA
ncbi:hypothetical protein WMY93_033841 [Mugilogobius chulae]|uniref:Tim10-like domain-containing protein n=1 Tax=Mugilogobius chulae TaxID=88201 RepID=A0AAW0MLQ6_9GOBI